MPLGVQMREPRCREEKGFAQGHADLGRERVQNQASRLLAWPEPWGWAPQAARDPEVGDHSLQCSCRSLLSLGLGGGDGTARSHSSRMGVE